MVRIASLIAAIALCGNLVSTSPISEADLIIRTPANPDSDSSNNPFLDPLDEDLNEVLGGFGDDLVARGKSSRGGGRQVHIPALYNSGVSGKNTQANNCGTGSMLCCDKDGNGKHSFLGSLGSRRET